ncbi:MAG: hypothetical protein NC334_09435, partial [Bacteroides sp.]|nr:hypothetical protein [Bacteroides sp.]
MADFAFTDESDFTGEAFFTPPEKEVSVKSEKSDSHATTPPIKLLRLKLKQRAKAKANKKYELAPTASDVYTGEIGTSDYASKDLIDDFEEMSPDGFEADEEAALEVKKDKKPLFRKKDKAVEEKDTEDIV